MVKIENGDHNGTWTFPGYFQSVNKCIYEVMQFVCSIRLFIKIPFFLVLAIDL